MFFPSMNALLFWQYSISSFQFASAFSNDAFPKITTSILEIDWKYFILCKNQMFQFSKTESKG